MGEPRKPKAKPPVQVASADSTVVDMIKAGLQAERALLGGIMLRGATALEDALDVVTDDDFGHPATKVIFQGMMRMLERGEHIDIVTLDATMHRLGARELVGGIEGLAKLDRFATAHNIRAHASIVRECSTKRGLYEWHRKQLDLLAADDLGGPELLAYLADSRVQHERLVSSGSTTADLLTVDAVADEFMADWDQRNEGRQALASLGFPVLDELTGLTPGALVGLLGKSGHGKTSVMLSMIVALQLDVSGEPMPLAEPTPTLVCSGEMTNKQLMGRLASNVMSIDGRLVTRPNNETNTTRRLLEYGTGLFRGCPFHWMNDKQAGEFARTVVSIRQFAAKYEGSTKTPVAFVDFLQLLQVTGQWERVVTMWDHVLRTYASLAKSLGIVIVVLLQPVKTKDERLTIADVREAGTLENLAKVVLGVYRPFMQRSPDDRQRTQAEWARLSAAADRLETSGRRLDQASEQRLAELDDALTESFIDVLKARDGNTGAVRTRFHGNYTRFREAEDQD